ncbi:hypothetical protein NPIL_429101 [Nephila pilipes]|uniref:Uncharacterized protein n=1 Tax=Nephila pilipes TaxID=299642 RepID=A0A8X6QDV9_NEPPI|nr:hypothetical protein NPIL_429101 [Nephila pilipes]
MRSADCGWSLRSPWSLASLSPSGAPEKRSLSSAREALWILLSCSRFYLQKSFWICRAVFSSRPAVELSLVMTWTFELFTFLCVDF